MATNVANRARWIPGQIESGLLLLAAFVLADVALVALKEHTLAVDAARSYLPAARDVLHGRSPYHPAEIRSGTAFASPPIAAFLFAPFLVFPSQVAEVLMAVLGLGSVLGALRIVGLRDLRCYAIAVLSYPMIFEFQTANLSGVIVLCAAIVWRYRGRSVVAGAAAGIAVALKLFCWPLVVFLLIRRGWRAAAIGVVTAALGILLPWAAIQFAGVRGYPHLLSTLADVERGQAYSVGPLLAPLLSWTGAEVGVWIIGSLLLVGAAKTQRSEAAFALCVATSVVLSPVVWSHYLVLLFVPLAVVAPVFTPAWLLPLAFWLSPQAHAAHLWQVAAVVAVGVAVTAVSVADTRLARWK